METNNETPTTSIEIIGTVERIIPASEDSPEMAQIFIACGDGTFAEIRVKNNLRGTNGKLTGLTKGAKVEISIKPDRRTKTTHA
jgi:hypothetical protein